MIDDVEIKIDSKRYEQALDSLTGKDWLKIAKKAVGAASRIIVTEAKKNFRKVTSAAKSKHSNAKNRWHIKKKNGVVVGVRSLEEGIRSKTHTENGMTDIFAKVNIMADHRLKWFEKGTKERESGRPKAVKSSGKKFFSITDKNGMKTSRWKYKEHTSGAKMKRGKMTASWFFKRAQDSATSSAYAKEQEIIDRELSLLWYKNQS